MAGDADKWAQPLIMYNWMGFRATSEIGFNHAYTVSNISWNLETCKYSYLSIQTVISFEAPKPRIILSRWYIEFFEKLGMRNQQVMPFMHFCQLFYRFWSGMPPNFYFSKSFFSR